MRNIMLTRLSSVQKAAARVEESLRDKVMTLNKWSDARYGQEFERHLRRYRTANNRYKAATSKLDQVD